MVFGAEQTNETITTTKTIESAHFADRRAWECPFQVSVAGLG